MAGNNQNTSSSDVRSYDGGLNEGIKDYHSKSNQWTFARNAFPNSKGGDSGDLGNAPSNVSCIKTPYPIIGFVYLFADTWAVFSTDDTNSEIGRFVESTCTYIPVVNDTCLNFKRTNLITGISKENHDCSWWVYFADGLNPDRALNFDKPQFIKLCTDTNGNTQLGNNPPSSPFYPVGCITCVDTTALDCDAIRMAHLVTPPCIQVKRGVGGGNLLNGSYFVVPAYKINGQRITDYFSPSNVQPLFDHSNVAGSLDIEILSADTRFDEMEIVIVSIVNQQTQAKVLGTYSTRQGRISIDIIDNKLVDVPLSQIPLHTPIADKSDAIYEVGDYAIRVAPTMKFDFNYQPFANQIVAKWQSVEYAGDYYRKGGSNVGHMRDEVYPYFIQWEYDDGDLSSSYHIPGRPPIIYNLTGTLETASSGGAADALDPGEVVFEVYNTATIIPSASMQLPDGGVLLSEGYMGYWESSEKYPDDKPDIWNAGTIAPPYSGTGPNDYDLCGKNIRHHKFPEQRLHPTLHHFIGNSPNFNGPAVRIMGVKFENILPPVDNNGVPIPGIKKYRILRGSREGNKTIVAKGIINNTFQYNIPGGTTTRTGLYPNFPYNDVTTPDDYIAQFPTVEVQGTTFGIPNTHVNPTVVTFHSPDTNFRHPFLSTKELKIYGELHGNVEGYFQEPAHHPKHKFVTDLAFIVAAVSGMGIASLTANGKRTTEYVIPQKTDFVDSGLFVGPTSGASGLDNPTTDGFLIAAEIADSLAKNTLFPLEDLLNWDIGGQLLQNIVGVGTGAYYTTLRGVASALGDLEGMSGYTSKTHQEAGQFDNIPLPVRALNGIATFSYFWSQGTDATLDLIRALMPFQQYALQYQSHCFYNLPFGNPTIGHTRRLIEESSYLDNQIQEFGSLWRVNNLHRSNCVALQHKNLLNFPVGDDSKRTVRTALGTKIASYQKQDVLKPFKTNAASHYVALKNRIVNQYGQIGGVLQIPIPACYPDLTSSIFPVSTPILFGGDTYITRYTEKNTMPFFYDWLYGQPDGYEFNYNIRQNVPFPKYWMDTHKFDISEFISNSSLFGPYFTPSSMHAFDRGGLTGFFEVREAYMYLFCSGVRDFYVESEVNTDFRDWEDTAERRHYDAYRYTDLKGMFNAKPEVIKAGNFYKYDYSLSVSKLFTNFISWATVQPINYDPQVYASCYTHYPNRLLYSLPQQFESIKDYWLVYLPNNYKDFKTHVTCIKPINKNGGILFFETESPIQFVGVDTLQTDAGTKVTIGDGGLFSQPLQSVLNAERAFEYGSCQNSRSVVNTPMGTFWMSQSQGKIFNLQGGVEEISLDIDMKWWFAQYLPYQLTRQFPDFELTDNPVIGIGCQTAFDNENTLVYFMKRDFIVREDLPAGTTVTYVSGVDFLVNGLLPIKLGDPAYFEDASWCVLFDPKTKQWIGWSDWKAELCMPGKNTFLTSKTDVNGQGGLWVHNETALSYCNFYGVDYPFEVEYRVNTATQVNVLRSVEHFVEFYIYGKNEHDRFLELENYFDVAVVHNTEQVSGYLNLVNTPHNNPLAIVGYPKVNFNSIDILYSKVESKYRFNQFFDITKDRGEFSNAKQTIWNTAANGYVKVLNPQNLDYGKNEFQRKVFRGYTNSVWLQKKVSGSSKILVLLTTNKLLNSSR